MDESPIHIIKIKVVQVGGRHLWVSFFIGARQIIINKKINAPKTKKMSYLLKVTTCRERKFSLRGDLKILA
ncbi:hypothetical protein EKQ63_00460 (plasmid) [Bacillus sp. BD59S]|nr:hypothetical protein EKQ63_00460 [Bacillus sp. BD59S]